MGRELRRVPPNWEHPLVRSWPRTGQLQPMLDEHIEDALAEWLGEFDQARAGTLDDLKYYTDHANPFAAWLNENSPPDPSYCRPWRDDEAIWFQVWETVSEGTPVTPPFATKEGLVDYLVEHGDYWQQKRWRDGDSFMQPEPPGYSRAAAERFVELGYAPSMIVMHSSSGTTIAQGIASCEPDEATR